MKLVEVASPLYQVEFTGRASIPTNEDPEVFVNELKNGDHFTFGGIYLMTDEVKLNSIHRVKGAYVVDVSVKGTVRTPPGTSPSVLAKVSPAVFKHHISVQKINTRPVVGPMNANRYNESYQHYVNSNKLTSSEVRDLVRYRQVGDNELSDEIVDKLCNIFSDMGEIPYGVLKARTGDPNSRVDRKIMTMSDFDFASLVKDNSTSDPRTRMGGKRPQAKFKPMGG